MSARYLNLVTDMCFFMFFSKENVPTRFCLGYCCIMNILFFAYDKHTCFVVEGMVALDGHCFSCQNQSTTHLDATPIVSNQTILH